MNVACWASDVCMLVWRERREEIDDRGGNTTLELLVSSFVSFSFFVCGFGVHVRRTVRYITASDTPAHAACAATPPHPPHATYFIVLNILAKKNGCTIDPDHSRFYIESTLRGAARTGGVTGRPEYSLLVQLQGTTPCHVGRCQRENEKGHTVIEIGVLTRAAPRHLQSLGDRRRCRQR